MGLPKTSTCTNVVHQTPMQPLGEAMKPRLKDGQPQLRDGQPLRDLTARMTSQAIAKNRLVETNATAKKTELSMRCTVLIHVKHVISIGVTTATQYAEP